MSVTIALSKIDRSIDKIGMTVSGTLNTTVLNTRLTVVDPDNVSYIVNLSPEEFSVPTVLPLTREILATMLGLTSYSDGVWSFTYTVNYTDASQEITPAAYILFDNNTVIAYMALMTKHIGLDCICGNEPTHRKRSSANELIEAAETFFELVRFDEARKSLSTALEFINDCD